MNILPEKWGTGCTSFYSSCYVQLKTIDIIYKINMEDPERGVEESRPVKDHGTQETNFL